MTEKLYRMVNTNLVDDDGSVYYLIKKDEDDVCQVFGKHTAKAIVDELNNLHEEKEYWKSDACNSMNLQSMLSFEIGKLTETRNIDAFLDFYYKYFHKTRKM